jgi:ribonuclease HII
VNANKHSSPDLSHEFNLWKSGYMHVGGIDEAGRGAWAGPVFAAVVILENSELNTILLGNVRDSKQMTPMQRKKWRLIIKRISLDWGVGSATNKEIDASGIGPATQLAVQRAMHKLHFRPDALLLDYIKLTDCLLPQIALVRGDQQVLSIAAASILAKTERDKFMEKMAVIYPGYSFQMNKGYGTAAHQSALQTLGCCRIHRQSFKPIKLMI